jgi:hypothetical protein
MDPSSTGLLRVIPRVNGLFVTTVLLWFKRFLEGYSLLRNLSKNKLLKKTTAEQTNSSQRQTLAKGDAQLST